jgi:hypothetical protein
MFETKQIKLELIMRENQKNYKPKVMYSKKTRKRIETLLSQLCDQFMIRRNYAKTFNGFKSRLLTKNASLPVVQLISFKQGKKINNLKAVIAKIHYGLINAIRKAYKQSRDTCFLEVMFSKKDGVNPVICLNCLDK